jgi:hypothetical protein
MFLACEGTHLCGTTYALLDRERPETGRVGGMWVPSNPVLQIIEMECDFRMTARPDDGTMART